MVDGILKDNSGLSEEKYKQLAQGIGLNLDKFSKDLKEKDAEWEKLLDADMAEGESVDVRGTPTFFLNGKKTMARDLAGYKREIDAILNNKGN
jgi:protein-disulfide isomerase